MGIYTERTGSTREDLAHKIALLVSDEEPPGMSGYALIRALRGGGWWA